VIQIIRLALRYLLGAALFFAGIGHLTFLRTEFRAQVPSWIPLETDFVVLASGVVEIILGLSLVITGPWIPWVGLLTAAFFVAIFPGNLNQYLEGIDAFGLNTGQARFTRLLFQPLLVVWALWSAGVIPYYRVKHKNFNS
jgi:uncharacterized membrane protein